MYSIQSSNSVSNCGTSKCRVGVPPSIELPQEHFSMSLQSTLIQFIDDNNSLLGISPFNAYSFMIYSLSSTMSSSNYSNDIVGFEVYPLSPDTISLYTADANFE